MRGRRVLYIVSEDAPGMRPYATTILQSQLNAESHALIVIRSEESKRSYSSLPQQTITFIDYPQGKLSKLMWHFYPKRLVDRINDVIAKNDIDLVYTLTGEISLAYVFGAIQSKVKVLHTVHDANEHDMKHTSVVSLLKHKILVAYPSKMMCRKAKNLITNSKNQVEALQMRFPKKQVFYAPFPTLVNDAIKNGGKAVAELAGIDDYILFFGNVNLYKGVHLLHALYRNNKASLGDRKLVIAGVGDNYYGEHDDADVIRINRFVDDSELKDLFGKASLVVYPYISATQSGVLSIASYFGKKMVLSNVPFFASIAEGQKGIKAVDVNDEVAFLDAMKEMLSLDEDSKSIYADVYESSKLKEVISGVYDKICK
ncbi:MAG: glycosyltransferase [Muribaculaceae bacterium]|nr:glycosyltransferase [Muribaculaceae bacterium]